ncbi:MAG: TolC family protein [Planctomycetota bacterium]
MKRAAVHITAGAAIVWAVGCTTPLNELDREVDRMVEARQAMSLSESGRVGVSAGSPAEFADDARGVYDEDPVTLSPAVDSLPAQRADPGAIEAATEAGEEFVQNVGEPVTFDLESLLAYAIEHAPEYRNRKEALFLTTLSLIVERHLWGPRFFSTITGSVSGTPEAGDFDQVADLVGDLRMTQRLPYGGDVSVGALVEYTRLLQQEIGTGGRLADDDFASLSFTGSFNLPLLRGAGQVARESLIQAERDLIYEVREFERFRREFFVSLASDYFGLILRLQQIDNREQQVESLERLRDRFDALAEAGREPYFEAERSESELLTERSRLISELDAYQSALDRLKLRVGLDTQRPVEIVPVEIEVPVPTLESQPAIEAGLSYRLDLQTQRDRVDDAVRGVRVAKNGLLPDLDAFGNIRLPAVGDVFEEGVELDAGQGDYRVGLEFDAPLDRKIEWTAYRRALIDLERSRRSTSVLEDRVALEVRDSIRQIEQADINLRLQERSVEINERRLISVRLRERSLGPRDVIEAQEALVDAQNERDSRIRDLRLNVLNFLLDTGQMRVGARGQWLPPARLVPAPLEPAIGPDGQAKAKLEAGEGPAAGPATTRRPG